MTTTGYGDITAQVTEEKLVNIFIIFLGLMVYSLVIGGIMATLANNRAQRMAFEDDLSTVTTYLHDNNINADVIKDVNDYYAYVWDRSNGTDANSLLKELPESMKTELALFTSKEIITKVPLFNNGSSGFYALVARSLEMVLFLPGQCVVRKDDVGSEMFFLVKGECEVINDDGKAVVTLNEGTFFGEIAIILGVRRTATIRAKTHCEMLQLSKHNFDNILEACPEMKPQCQMKANEKRKQKPGVASQRPKKNIEVSPNGQGKGVMKWKSAAVNALHVNVKDKDRERGEAEKNNENDEAKIVAELLTQQKSRSIRSRNSSFRHRNPSVRRKSTIVRNNSMRISTSVRGVPARNSLNVSGEAPMRRPSILKNLDQDNTGSEVELRDVADLVLRMKENDISGYDAHPLERYLNAGGKGEGTQGLLQYWKTIIRDVFSLGVVEEDSDIVHWWNAVIILFTCLDGVLLPIHALVNVDNLALWVIPYVGTPILALDIFIRSRIRPPLDHSDPTSSRSWSRESIAKRYMKRRFGFHLLTMIPFEATVVPFGYYQIGAILRLIRCLRVFEIPSLFNHYTKKLGKNIELIESMKFMSTLLIINIWYGCLWYATACFDDKCNTEKTWLSVYNSMYKTSFDQLSPGSEFLTAFYWAAATLTSTGYGDIRALETSTVERMLSVIGMIAGVILFGFITSMLSSLLSHGDMAKLSYIHKLELTQKWMRSHSVSRGVLSRVEGFYRHTWTVSHGIDEPQTLLNRLPKGVEAGISVMMNKDVMLKADLFRFTDMGFLRSLALVIKPVLFFPGDTVVREGDVGSSMYFIKTGEVIVSTQAAGNMCVLEPGSFFGEISLFHNIRRTATITAQGVCEAIMVCQADFNKLLDHYPKVRKIINGIAERRYLELQDALQESALNYESEETIATDSVESDSGSVRKKRRRSSAAASHVPAPHHHMPLIAPAPAKTLNTIVASENDCVPVLYPGEVMDFELHGGVKVKADTLIEMKARELAEKEGLASRMDDLTQCEGKSRAGSAGSIDSKSMSGLLSPESNASVRGSTISPTSSAIPHIKRLTQSRMRGEMHQGSTVSLTISMHDGETGTTEFAPLDMSNNSKERTFKSLPNTAKSNMLKAAVRSDADLEAGDEP